MPPQQQASDTRLKIENIGGIDSVELDFSPGITLLVGENATNRSSTIAALKGVLGSTDLALKTGANSGSIEMRLEDAGAYTRTIDRSSGSLTYGGDPYLEDEKTIRQAELFACLDRGNDIRESVRAGGADLRDVLMEPVDMEDIEAEIRELQTERRELKAELKSVEQAQEELITLTEHRDELQNRLEGTAEEIEALEADLQAQDMDITAIREEQQEIDETLNELDELRSSLETVEQKLETARRSRDKTAQEREEVTAELEALEVEATRIEELNADIRQLTDRRTRIDQAVSSLESIIQFNSQLLEQSRPEAMQVIGQSADEGETDERTQRITQQLTGDRVRCWTCGSTVEIERIDERLEDLRAMAKEKRRELADLDSELAELEEQRDALVADRDQKRELEQWLSDLDAELETRKQKIAELETEKQELEDEIAELSARLEEIELGDDEKALLDVYQQVSELEREYGRLESQLEQVNDDIAECKTQAERADEIEARIADLTDAIEERRTRVDRLESTTIEQFNTHMASILDRLAFDNIARVWLEKQTSNGTTSFALNVVREVDGTMHDDTLAHLSESEREVTGLVVALAGNLAYDLAETVPFVALDSVEGLDATRLAEFTEYLAQFIDYVLVSVLPEDSNAMPDTLNRIHFDARQGVAPGS